MKSILQNSKQYVVLFLLGIISFTINAQQWTESMHNPKISFFEVQRQFNDYFKGKEYEKGKGWKQFKRWEYLMETRVDSNGLFTHNMDAYFVYEKIQKEYTQARISQGTAGRWTSLGPEGAANNGGAGRLNSISYHPTNSNFMIAGAATGGIWFTSNAGVNWYTYTDNLASLGVTTVEISKSNPNIAYAATGDANGTDTYSIGVVKSTDGGKHWVPTNLAYNLSDRKLVYKILVDPTNHQIVYANTSFGIFKTLDGGTTWTKIRYGVYRDMEFKPGDVNTIYFAAASTILKTSDAGATFSTLSLTPAVTSNRLELAVTEDDPNYLYVVAGQSSDGGFGGFYRSINSGATFTTQSTTPNILGWKRSGSDQGGQAYYDLAIDADPNDKNVVFVGGINIWKSVNGGSTWTINTSWTGFGAPYVHADIHGLEFSPHAANAIWAVTDGGAFRSSNSGFSWSEINNGLAIGQMYRMGSSKTNANKIITGWQDNGSSIYSGTWDKTLGGDGMECIIDYSNNSIMYGSLYYGRINRTANGGSSWTEITTSIPETGAWVTPYVMHPTNSAILYAGYINVYKTVNKGASWSKISSFSGSQTIRAMAVAPSNPSVIYTATYSGAKRTVNGGVTWLPLGSVGSSSISYFAVNPTDPDDVWVTLNGYFDGDKVLKSTDGGASWTNISDSLPNLPANCIVYEQNSADGLYIGMDVGVYYRDNNLNRWVPFMKGLPNVIVKELEIYDSGQKIRAATYGRSMWESDLYPLANSINSSAKSNKQELKIYPNPTNDILNIELDGQLFGKTVIRVLNSFGRVVTIINKENESLINISVSELSSGLYFIELQTDNDVYYGKFIKN